MVPLGRPHLSDFAIQDARGRPICNQGEPIDSNLVAFDEPAELLELG